MCKNITQPLQDSKMARILIFDSDKNAAKCSLSAAFIRVRWIVAIILKFSTVRIQELHLCSNCAHFAVTTLRGNSIFRHFPSSRRDHCVSDFAPQKYPGERGKGFMWHGGLWSSGM